MKIEKHDGIVARILCAAALLAAGGLPAMLAEEFSTSASWTTASHGWTVSTPDTNAKVLQAGEDEGQSPDGSLVHSGEVRLSVQAADDENGTTGSVVDLAPRMYKSPLVADAINNLPSSDWCIETAIMQPDPNHTGLDNTAAPYGGAFSPKRISGISSTSSHAGLLLWVNASTWIMWGQANNNSMLATGYLHGTRLSIPLNNSTMYQYFRIRKRSNDVASHVRYYFEASGDVNLNDVYSAPTPENHPGSRYGWVSLGVWDDTNGDFSGTQYGLMARTPGPSGMAGPYSVQFGYFFEGIPVTERDDFASPFTISTSNVTPYIFNQGTGTSTATVETSAPFTLPIYAYSDLLFQVTGGDKFTPTGGYAAPTVLKAAKYADWIIDTKISGAVTPSGTKSNAGLLIYKDASNWIHLGQYPGASPAVMNVAGNLAGTYSNPIIGDSAVHLTVTGLHNYLRVRKAGNIYLFQWSDDAITWTKIGTLTTPALAGAKYGFMASSVATNTTSFTVKFDYLREYPQPNGAIKNVVGAPEISRLIGPSPTGYSPAVNIPQAVPPPGINLNGGDLGSMVELGNSPTTVYMMFGDNQDATTTHSHRPNALGFSSDSASTQETGGPNFHSVMNYTPIASARTDFSEATRIPTNGIGVNSIPMLYYSFQSIYHWSVAASHWDSVFSRFAQSSTGSGAWTDLNGAGNPQWAADSNFIQSAIATDGTYAYVFGTPAGGYGNVRLARVPLGSIADNTKYTYYTGLSGGAAWSMYETAAVTIVQGPIREFSVQYSSTFGRWVMMGTDDNTRNIEIRDAANPQGPWSNPITAVDVDSPLATEEKSESDGSHLQSYIYGGYMTPKLMTGTSTNTDLYFSMTKFKDYSVYWNKITVSSLAP
jgi:regulation of enolase protein 1 (concanavalin A-like superfamily)